MKYSGENEVGWNPEKKDYCILLAYTAIFSSGYTVGQWFVYIFPILINIFFKAASLNFEV